MQDLRNGHLALLFAVKGSGMRAFYRWLTRDYQPLFPQVPERTRLARLFKTHTAWTARFRAAPTVLGVADSYGIELIHPMREGRIGGLSAANSVSSSNSGA